MSSEPANEHTAPTTRTAAGLIDATPSLSTPMTELRTLWWSYARVPLILFLLAATLLASTSLDPAIAHSLFFDEAAARWIGKQDLWADTIAHTGGAWAIRGVGLVILAVLIASHAVSGLMTLRRPALYVFLAMLLSVGIVGALQVLTNVDCPWNLHEFGGRFPFVHLFADRPDDLRPAHCFPAAHASSGYALVAFYFALRERYRAASIACLVAGLLVGLIFGFAQQSRGAHFLSHDVWSAFLAWMISLTLYTAGFKAAVWRPDTPIT